MLLYFCFPEKFHFPTYMMVFPVLHHICFYRADRENILVEHEHFENILSEIVLKILSVFYFCIGIINLGPKVYYN